MGIKVLLTDFRTIFDGFLSVEIGKKPLSLHRDFLSIIKTFFSFEYY